MSETARSIAEMLDVAALEDTVGALRAAHDELAEEDPDALSEVAGAILDRVVTHRGWRDAKEAVGALRFCVELSELHGLGDGDTATRLLLRAIELDPDDDALVLEYLRCVANTDYRFAGRSLLDVVTSPERAQRLALLDTIAEWFVLRPFLDPPGESYVSAMQRSLGAAIALGADEARWLDARSWVLEGISFASRILPEDVYRKYAPPHG